MPPSHRQRLVDAIWSELANVLKASNADRTLRTALTTSTSLTGTGHVTTLAPGQALTGINRRDDLALSMSIPVVLEDLRPSAATLTAPVVERVKNLETDFAEFERHALSQLVANSTDTVHMPLATFPDGLVEAIIDARNAMGPFEDAIDLLLVPAHRDLLPEKKDRLIGALRGGSVLVAAHEADGLLTPHLPGPLSLAEVEPLTLDWDHGPGSDAVTLTLSERLRFWRTEPKPQVVDLDLH